MEVSVTSDTLESQYRETFINGIRLGVKHGYLSDKLLDFDLEKLSNSLDLNTEKEIISEINNLKGIKTIIFVSHRMTALEMCDKIFKIEKGKLSLVN